MSAHSVAGRARSLLLPSFSDWLFVALMGWLFVAGSGWSGLLADGDTGWHIRAGEYVLDHGGPPRRDPFSFTKAGEPWCAWEWLADALFALLYRQWGLKGVVLAAGGVIALALVLVFRHMLWRGANALVALAVCLLAAGASGIHFLARPHAFTFLLLAVSLWLLDRDRRAPTAAVWLLAPLTALWANLHAGFFALLASIGVAAAGAAVEKRSLRGALRHLALLAACAAASLANPYGAALHRHALEYLRSDWIREAVDEFQSPKFRSESALQFEVLLFAGLLLAGSLLGRRRITDALLVALWAHAALVSVRHVPVYALAASPILASEASLLWSRWAAGRPARSVAAILERLAADFRAGCRRTSLLAPALLAALALLDAPLRWPRDFPEVKFPVALAARQAQRLSSARVFTSDQWGDYLIYRFHPGQRVFIDGRSDFYGPALGGLYLRIAYGHPEWREALDRYGCALVLAPREWPLASLLGQSPGWRLVDRDAGALLFERAAGANPQETAHLR